MLYCDAKHSDILEGPATIIVTCFTWCFINVIKPKERNKIILFFSYFELQKGLLDILLAIRFFLENKQLSLTVNNAD